MGTGLLVIAPRVGNRRRSGLVLSEKPMHMERVAVLPAAWGAVGRCGLSVRTCYLRPSLAAPLFRSFWGQEGEGWVGSSWVVSCFEVVSSRVVPSWFGGNSLGPRRPRVVLCWGYGEGPDERFCSVGLFRDEGR